MPKKDGKGLGVFLGSPESFASQFFSQLVLEPEIRSLFHDVIDRGILIRYACQDCAISHGSGVEYQHVLYTDIGIIVSDILNSTYMTLDSYFFRSNILTGSVGSVRYDTIYVDNAVMATWTAFLAYLRSGGVTDAVRTTGRLPGQGLLYSYPVIALPADSTRWNAEAGQTEHWLYDFCRPYLIDLYLKQKEKKGPLGQMADKMFTRSQEMWPEMKGLWTRFVDNIGIYLPNYMDVDINATMDFGSQFVVCHMTRMPTSTWENYKFMTDYLMRFINAIVSGSASAAYGSQGSGSHNPGLQNNYDYGLGYTGSQNVGHQGFQGGAAAGAAIQAIWGAVSGVAFAARDMTLESIRFLMPRVRGFGRQYSPDFYGNISQIPTYDQAVDKLFSMTSGQAKKVEKGYIGPYYYKKIVLLPREDWDKFVSDMNIIVSSSASATGGLQGFPY